MKNQILINQYTQTTPHRIDLSLTINEETFDIFFEAEGVQLNKSSDALYSLLFLIAMRLNCALPDSIGPVSPRLLCAELELQDYYQKCRKRLKPFPRYQHAALPQKINIKESKFTASFFSGGLDSIYTLEKNFNDIDYLLFVLGFDIPVDNMPLKIKIQDMLEKTHKITNKKIIFIQTNLRVLLDRFTSWEISHGAAMVTVSYLLDNGIGQVFTPSSTKYTFSCTNRHYGSSLLLDQLWSTEKKRLIHDGYECNRIEKFQIVQNSKLAQKILRICFNNFENHYNCGYGNCIKCTKTIALLSCLGVSESFETLPNNVESKQLKNTILISDVHIDYFKTCLKIAGNQDIQNPTTLAIKDLLQRSLSRHYLNKLMYKNKKIRKIYFKKKALW